MATHQVKDQYNKKLLKMANITNMKPTVLLMQIIEDYYFKFLKENKLKDR